MAGDFDPRDVDSRERDDESRHRDVQGIVHGPGRGSGSPCEDARQRSDDWREQRDREIRVRDDSREVDPRVVFSRDLDLPRDRERELVHDRDRHYRLNGSDVRTLSTAGAFRIVSERDLRDSLEAFDVRDHDLRNLERQGLIERVPVNGHERAVTLTDRGRGLLDRHREGDSDHCQAFYSRADRPRERSHDVQVYRAYLKAAARLHDRDTRIVRVQLDRELKREYQRFLQERNRGDRDCDGRPDRCDAEIAAWAREHNLPYFDDQVHFPDVRIEYEDANGDTRYEDIEVITEHYRGGHRASAARCGFSMHDSRSAGGRTFDPRVAEDFV
jgi:hypothetical protein